jgi:hypothetical protein
VCRCNEISCLVATVESSLKCQELYRWIHSAQGHVTVEFKLADELVWFGCKLFAGELDLHSKDVFNGLSHHLEDLVLILG